MTITEKILAAHAGAASVRPGDIVDCRVDFVFANDITAPLAIREFEKMGVGRVFDPERVAFVFDHYVPAKDIASAQQCAITREFVRAHDLPHFYDIGRAGIAHVLLAEEGFVGPGDLFIGADSHTCNHGALGAYATGVGSSDMAAAMAMGSLWLRVPETVRFVFNGAPRPWVTGKDLILTVIGDIGVSGSRYGAMEFAGPALAHLTMDERFTLPNMAVEAGAQNGIIEPDETFAVVTGDLEAVSNDVVLDSVGPFARFWLMPRREVPLAEADWVICYGCDRGPAGVQLQPGALGFPEHVLYIGRPVR